jgi:hypothetical protein
MTLQRYSHHSHLYSSRLPNLPNGINVNANNDYGTPHDGSDDLNFGVGVTGSGTGTDTYSYAVSPLTNYRIEFNPDDALRVYYKDGVPAGTWIWDDASFFDASNDVSAVDVTASSGSTISGTISGLSEGQSFWAYA